MVVWEGSMLLNEHWEELKCVFRTWAAEYARYSVQKVLVARGTHADEPGHPCKCSLRGVGQHRFIMGVALASWEGWLLR